MGNAKVLERSSHETVPADRPLMQPRVEQRTLVRSEAGQTLTERRLGTVFGNV
jgi:hypothetical protein